jgi:hypothetical protein
VRLRVLASTLALLAALALAGRFTGPAAAPPESRPSASPTTPASSPAADPAGGDEMPGTIRDPFRYADDPAPRTAPTPARLPSTRPPSPSPPAEPAVRLVGLVRRPDGPRAAVAIAGEVVVLKRGESAGGWTLVTLDEEGARLRGPGGQEESLTFPE